MRWTAPPSQVVRFLWDRIFHASGLILAHDHPNGDPIPSAEDQLFTRRMAHACELVDICLVDHLILGAARR